MATVVRLCGGEYVRRHRVCQEGRRALDAICACRTPALGGHLEACEHCGAQRAVYHSCRNRHCPRCQVMAKERWLQARIDELLPIEYFHIVFTLPHELNTLAQAHPRLVHGLLFDAAAKTLLCFGADPKHLGARLGVTAILHTWGQNLSQHIHLHCIVTGGGLATDGQRWVHARKGFLFPVRALSRVFRAKYLEGLRRRLERGEFDRTKLIAPVIPTLAAKDWLVYAKKPFAGPETLLRYLGRYTHRIAISDDRILHVDETVVRFRWRDYRDGNRVKVLALAPDEFLRRFLLHVVPSGFMRVRHYGVFANRGRRDRIARCRQLLACPKPASSHDYESAQSILLRTIGIDLGVCPVCSQGRMAVQRRLFPGEQLDAAAHGAPP